MAQIRSELYEIDKKNISPDYKPSEVDDFSVNGYHETDKQNRHTHNTKHKECTTD